MKPKTTAKVLNQRHGLRDWTMLAFLLSLLSTTGVLRAQVTNIIYQDSFARVGPLNGSAPDTVNAPGATWVACNVPGLNAQVQTDGSEIALTNVPGTTNGFYLNGFLPFVPQVGHIYYLSCNIMPVSGGTNWLALGFATHALTNNFFNTYQCGSGWVGVRGNGSQFSSWGALTGFSNFTNAISNGFQTFTVVVDTTFGNGAGGLPNGNSQQGWQIRFYTNNVLVPGGNQTIAWGNYPIKYVGIGANAAQGYFQNFTLTDVLMRQGTPTIVEQPQNATAQVGQTASFWVGVTNDYPAAAYQWMTNGPSGPTNAIPGATNGFYTTPPLDMSYNGLTFSVTITNANGSTNSSSATLTVLSGPPTVYSVTKTTTLTNLVVAFSKAVDPATALNPANYSALTVNGTPSGLSILSASYGSTSNNIILGTSTLNTNTGYYLKVQNVQDLFGNAMISRTNAVLPAGLVFFVRADSGVVYDSSGSLVAQWLDQTTNANNMSQFFGVPTAGPTYLGSVVRPTTNIINNGQLALDFGTTIHWLAAPSTPSLESLNRDITMYSVVKFTAGSDEIVNKVWGNLPAPFDWDPSPNENVQYGNGGNNAPANGVGGVILTNTPYVLATSLTFPPENGLATNNFNFWLNGAPNGSGNIRPLTDNPPTNWDAGFPLWVGARWDLVNPRMRGQIAEILLFNTGLSDADRTIVDNYLGIKYFTFAITTDLPATTTSSNGFAVTYTFVAGAGSAHGFSYQWQKNGTNISGATGTTYTTPILAPSDNGDTFDVQVTLPNGSFVYSTTNTLTVLNVAPYVTWAGIPIWNTTNQVIVTFDIAVDPVTGTASTNYSLNNGASVLSAAIGDTPNKVVLTTSPLNWNSNPNFYTLNVQNVMDLFGNTMAPATPSVGLYPPNTAVWIRANTGVVTDAGTNTVNFWNDLSGNSNNFSSSSIIEPQLVTNAWGDPVVRFNITDSVTNYMFASSSPTLAITGDMSVFAVVNFMLPGNGTHGEIVSKTGTGSTRNIPAPYDYYVGGAPALYRGNGNGANNGINYGQFTGTQGPTVSYPTVVAVTESGNTISHYLNGQSAGTGVLNGGFAETNDFDQGNVVWIGERSDFINRLAGDLSELIICASSVSSGDVAAMDNYFSTQHHLVLFNPSPTNLVYSYSSNQLTLSWPADHTGWQLQSNSVGLTATNSWFTVPGSTATNQITITPVANRTNVFYRMFFQQP